ncbi:MAG: hypothetical protein KTV68_14430 [Acidimicrobiia bacterium]|nr:hypothetical protein [Acidimicrobiia bacterium]MCY4432601.1 hypothetical protein [bacterium]
MALKQAIEQALKRIQSGVLKNEAQVKQAVIVPILRELGWDDSNPEEFLPEHQVDNGLVDYALLVHKKPQVFVEAKRLGNLSPKAEEQLFSYAANKGIPLLVLTDGSIWDFYLSMAAGEPANRRFSRIELNAHDGSLLSLHEKSFRKFLAREQVASGLAKRDAEALHEDTQRRSQAREAIPNAWEGLLNPPNDLLIELLAEEVEGKCGIQPRHEDVEHFFNQLASTPLSEVSPVRTRSAIATTPSPKPGRSTLRRKSPTATRRIVGYRIRTSEFQCSSASATLVALLKDFQEQDPSFLSRLYEDPRNHTRKRVLVSQRRSEMYSEPRKDSEYKDLGAGWWVGTNLSAQSITRKVELACDVAGVKFGTELTLIEEKVADREVG